MLLLQRQPLLVLLLQRQPKSEQMRMRRPIRARCDFLFIKSEVWHKILTSHMLNTPRDKQQHFFFHGKVFFLVFEGFKRRARERGPK